MITNAIRVLVVDDSLVFRKKLEQCLGEDRQIEVIGTAVDPDDAMRKIEALNPDVITMDVEMPKMSGIDFIRTLIPKRKIPVVVVSSMPISALDALEAGAVDFVKKPVVKQPSDFDDFVRDLIFKIKIARTAKVRMAPKNLTAPSLTQRLSATKKLNNHIIIAIGASTGGTEAILEVVKNLPETTPGIIVTQHMPAVFTNMYAQRLDRICRMKVKEAADMDRVETGRILVAAGEYHLRLMRDTQGYYVRSQKGEKVNGHCPSVDVMFDSVRRIAGRNAIGVLLTGMGADGAKGLTEMKKAGAYTIGQDQETSVVYGMPMEAFKMGGVVKQLPLDRIGDEILYRLSTP